MLTKKICMVGHFGVGKTSLVQRYVQTIYDDRYLTTVGVKIDKKEVVVKSRPVSLVLWDIAGRDDLADVNLTHLRGAAGYILVVDGCRAVTLETAVQLQQRITELYGSLPFVVALNKVDLAQQWEVKRSDIETSGWTSFDTSAKLGVGVDEVFLGLAEKLMTEGPGA
jgi:small GTP-binding protein